MSRVRVGGRSLTVDAFVFDKDGLLFESRAFWIALAEERLRQLRGLNIPGLPDRWAACFGVDTADGVRVTEVDPQGILAVASPGEEVAATAALIVQAAGLRWTEARNAADRVFSQADLELDLRRALRPRPGFPGIMERLRRRGIPYGVATSDTTERVLASFRLFDDPQALSFILSPRDVARGKPHPDMLQAAADRLGLPMDRIAMVGDSYVDMEMARTAGAVGIGIPETEEMARQMRDLGAIVLHSLDEICLEE